MKLILWDWNGTLVNDTAVVVDVFNRLSVEYGYNPVSLERYREIYRHPVRALYEDAGFDLSVHSFDEIAKRWSAIYSTYPDAPVLHHDARRVLHGLRDKGSRQAILSALPQPILKEAVATHGISHLFEGVHGALDDLGHGKVDMGVTVARILGVSGSDITVVGDSSHDAEVAQELGSSCILVSHGLESVTRLQATGFPVCHSLTEAYERLHGAPPPELVSDEEEATAPTSRIERA